MKLPGVWPHDAPPRPRRESLREFRAFRRADRRRLGQGSQLEVVWVPLGEWGLLYSPN